MLIGPSSFTALTYADAAPEGSTIYDFSLDMKGEPVSLKKYEGQVR